ncbi:MAG: hypothetical protein M3Y56_12625 [Armatimonadota bacterium]|nr:hypothetical protein [Armatimonadota bacterium]
MAFNDLTDSRSRDQYPVDDDQDGKMTSIDSEDAVIGEDGLPTPADIPSGLYPDDDYLHEDADEADDSADALQEEDTEDEADGPVQLQAANSDDDDDQNNQNSGDDQDDSQSGGYDTQDDNSGDAMSQFQDAHSQAGADQVRNVAAEHFGSADPDDFQQSVDQGVSGLADQHVGGLAGTLMNALQGAGLPANQVAQEAGLSSDQPDQMGKGDLSGLLGYAQKFAPGALGEAVANQPMLGQALGNPMVKGLLGKLFGG